MAIDQSSGVPTSEYIQLTTAHVPLEQAGDVLVSHGCHIAAPPHVPGRGGAPRTAPCRLRDDLVTAP